MIPGGSHYPVNLVVRGKRCLVVGGGAVAARKVDELLACGATVHVIAPDIVEAIRSRTGRSAEAGAPSVTCEQRRYRAGDLAGCWLAFAATGDPAVNAQVFDDGEEHRVWVNSADDPDRCTFTLPARIRQGRLLVTFSTGGASPALAAWLRERYEGEFGPEYSTLIDLLAEAREQVRVEGRPTGSADWNRALDSGTLGLIREGRLAEAKERLQACLSSSSD